MTWLQLYFISILSYIEFAFYFQVFPVQKGPLFFSNWFSFSSYKMAIYIAKANVSLEKKQVLAVVHKPL